MKKKTIIKSVTLASALFLSGTTALADVTNDAERPEYNQPYSYEIDPTGVNGLLPETVALHDQPGSVTMNTTVSQNSSDTNNSGQNSSSTDNQSQSSSTSDQTSATSNSGSTDTNNQKSSETKTDSLTSNKSNINKSVKTTQLSSSSSESSSVKTISSEDTQQKNNSITAASSVNNNKDEARTTENNTGAEVTQSGSEQTKETNDQGTSNSVNEISNQNKTAYSDVNNESLPDTGDQSNHVGILSLITSLITIFSINAFKKIKGSKKD